MATNSPLPGYEPNMTFDVPVPGHNPPNITSRSSLCSQATSVDNAPTITLSRSQSWWQRSECLASPLPRQEREGSDACASVSFSEREGAAPTALLSSGRPDAFALLRSNKRKTIRDQTSSTKEDELNVKKKIVFLQLREQQSLRLQQEASQQVMDMEFRT